MRPRLPDKEKRSIVIKLLMSREEKLRLDTLVKKGRYGCRSDFLRSRMWKTARRKTISLDEETFGQLKDLDYELNKIGVNLNQMAKRMNSFAGYRMGDTDRQLLRRAGERLDDCLRLLQKLLS
jgi:Arc/MetJ-type ribon-helix-helix transcriptional regulator